MPQRQERGQVSESIKHAIFLPYYTIKGLVHGQGPVKTIEQIADEAVQAAPIAIEQIGGVAESISSEVGSITGSFLKGLGLVNIAIIVGGSLLLLIILLKLL